MTDSKSNPKITWDEASARMLKIIKDNAKKYNVPEADLVDAISHSMFYRSMD